jgi:hypothetical protein
VTSFPYGHSLPYYFMTYNVYFIETDLLEIKIYCLYGISVCQNNAE